MIKKLSSGARLRNSTQRRLENYTNDLTTYYLMTALAASLASLGLLLDNTAIIIGAMLLAPLITPIIGFSLSLIVLRPKKLAHALFSISLGAIVTLLIAYLFGTLTIVIEGNTIPITNEMFVRTNPNLFYFLVALCSGLAGAYSYAKPKVLESVTAIAIAVAIVPPLAVSGLAFSFGENILASESFYLFLFNLAGICFGSIIMFLILGFSKDVLKK
jgi:uncharacterized hydrophobic protein (TIGR00271 family)